MRRFLAWGAVGLAVALVILARWRVNVETARSGNTRLGGRTLGQIVSDAAGEVAATVKDAIGVLAVNLKTGVSLVGVSQPMMYALGVADEVYRRVTGKPVTVTSLRDSHEDRPSSLHNIGNAADLRTRDLTPAQVVSVLAELRRILFPLGFDVVDESRTASPHIHIEYDPKVAQGRVFAGVIA